MTTVHYMKELVSENYSLLCSLIHNQGYFQATGTVKSDTVKKNKNQIL